MSSAALSFELAELQRAAAVVHAVLPATPQYVWPKLNQLLGCDAWVNHTPTGGFKVRGGLYYLEQLRRREPNVPGLISATRGNHGQSVAFAAARAGIPAVLCVPHGNSPDQNTSMAALGAQVIEVGRDFDEAKHEAMRLAAARGLHFVPSFHRDLVAGVASYALELFAAAPDLDTVYVGIGMGSGICALIAARDLLGLRTQIVGVCAAEAPAAALSFSSGRPVPTASARTFADGLATREPDPQAVATMCRGAARVLTVTEDAIAAALRSYYDCTHQIAEGAGAAPLAAALLEQQQLRGRRIGLVLTGGNIERARLLQVLSGQTPAA